MKLLLYCTKAKPYLVKRNIFAGIEPSYFTLKENVEDNLNGKIVAECDFEVKAFNYFHELNALMDNTFMQREMFEKVDYSHKDLKDLLNKSCLTYEQLANYTRIGYTIYIKNLHIFNKPKELKYVNLTRAPQNIGYGWTLDNEYQLPDPCMIMSIKPEVLCKILNGEKTVEIRKKVLREMLKNE